MQALLELPLLPATSVLLATGVVPEPGVVLATSVLLATGVVPATRNQATLIGPY